MLDQIARIVNWCILLTFVTCFGYQAIYFFARYAKKKQKEKQETSHNFAVLIAARNEEKVIARLIRSIQDQNYDKGTVDIYVVADNCTDRTAAIAWQSGAIVYERFHKKQVGKGYALEFLLNQMKAEQKLEDYDAYFIFDADNILDKNYIREINRTFSEGYPVVTSYRNSTNFGSNWISFGYGLWFLHEAQFLNRGRYAKGSSCMVSGTGYMISKDIILKNDGWKYFLLTEDIEFTADCIANGIKIGYCEQAMFFDEQPTRFRDSWNQRLRWVKGYYQVFQKYHKALSARLVKTKELSCYDMLMVDLPAFLVTAGATAAGLILFLAGIVTSQSIQFVLYSCGMFVVKTFIAMFVLGIYTVACEWNRIQIPAAKKILYLFSFPLFMYTYFPIAIAALGKNVSWKPIAHGEELKKERGGKPRLRLGLGTMFLFR